MGSESARRSKPLFGESLIPRPRLQTLAPLSATLLPEEEVSDPRTTMRPFRAPPSMQQLRQMDNIKRGLGLGVKGLSPAMWWDEEANRCPQPQQQSEHTQSSQS